MHLPNAWRHAYVTRCIENGGDHIEIPASQLLVVSSPGRGTVPWMVDLPPGGTRGAEVPKALRPLIKAMGWTGSLMFRSGAKVQGRPLLRLTTKGAKSGKRRQTVLGWFADGDQDGSWFVVGSNAGSARHPAWAFNLAKNPGDVLVDLGDGEFPVEAELLIGAERDSVWSQVVELAPGYGRYLEKTDREMPIFRLSRRTQNG